MSLLARSIEPLVQAHPGLSGIYTPADGVDALAPRPIVVCAYGWCSTTTTFIADGQSTIIGGRNVGDECFGAAEQSLFVDLDVIAIGSVVQEVEQGFERRWNSVPARPARALLAAGEPKQLVSCPSGASARPRCVPASLREPARPAPGSGRTWPPVRR
ncbi:MAG: hypothetical protein IV094_15820 [Vitreoscilla sp.]|nr:hypothetical protein [Vitreoscilla sp.]